MTEQELRNRIADIICEVVNDVLSASSHKNKSPMKRADSIISLIKADGWMKPQNHPQKSDAVNDYHEELTGERW